MVNPPIIYALVTLTIALFGGLLPVLSKVKENPERLKTLTGIAAGIIIASAMLVVIPEGYELATAEEPDSEIDGWLLGGAILGGFVLMLLLKAQELDTPFTKSTMTMMTSMGMTMFITATMDG